MEEQMKLLREAIKTGSNVKVIHKYYLKLPTEEAHHQYHPTQGLMGLSQRVHPELIVKVQELVCAGVTDSAEVQRLLKLHVRHYNNVPRKPSQSQ